MHVSELAKMAKRFPDRAREVVNGGFESVPTNGTIIVESTHEGGRSGVNYNLMKTAMSKRGSLFSRWIGGFSFPVVRRKPLPAGRAGRVCIQG